MTSHTRPLRVAMIGHGFMGAAHSQGWRIAPRFFDLERDPQMAVLVGRSVTDLEKSAEKWGWPETSTDWREVIARDDIDVIDIVTPGDSHAEIAIAALAAGKHVLCEKPLANTLEEAADMSAAASRAAENGTFAMLGFTYRRMPAVTFARDLVAKGRLGVIRQVRVAYLQDWLRDEDAPMSWRLQKEHAGSGALGDLGAHAIDLAQFVTGEDLLSVSGVVETIVATRPHADRPEERATVTVDDVALFTGRFASGALGTFEATRFSTGRKNSLRLEISGSDGAISFDLEDLNRLEFYDATLPAGEQGFTSILVTEPQHPYLSAWWPTGHMLGYEHGFTHQARDFLSAVTAGVQPAPSFADGLQVQGVLAAVQASSQDNSAWTSASTVPVSSHR
jgi:predicted dehydrogenase